MRFLAEPHKNKRIKKKRKRSRTNSEFLRPRLLLFNLRLELHVKAKIVRKENPFTFRESINLRDVKFKFKSPPEGVKVAWDEFKT